MRYLGMLFPGVLGFLVPGVLAAAAFALVMNAGKADAQTAAVPGTGTAAKSTPAAGHHRHGTEATSHPAEMKAECQAMMAKKQEAEDKVKAMDATMDKLVAEMNAAKGSREVDAMEKPMAAVINELVVQRKALQAMMMEMQPAMMAHMGHHMHGAKGTMECPMMKMDKAPEKKTGM